ncbi:hypothetical protein ACIBL3_40920 [Kribbella sp. NPDC050124]|uniref:hypothetical protein n=1 Tax=Kribbella sp. NPDC050124 TaxID=3364114 RepID=UPI00379FDE62
MSVGEYRVLQWSGGFDGDWAAGGVDRYREGEFDGLSLYSGGGWTPGDLEFLGELPGLRYLDVNARVSKDLAAFQLDGLEALTLVTGSRRAVPDVVQSSLRTLCLTDRPGIAVAGIWPALERLRLGGWRGSDLEFLRGAERLSSVQLEGRRQKGGLAGIETCRSLVEFTSINYSIEDSAPMRELQKLREVKLMAAPPTHPHRRISGADLAAATLEKIWISNADRLEDIDVLSALPRLRNLRLVHCHLTAEDTRALAALTRTKVELIDSR